MARTHGKNANFSYNGVALESFVDSITQTASVAESDITSFNDSWQNFIAGKKNITTEISGSADFSHGASGSDQTLFEGIGAGVKTTVFDPTGSGPATNDPEYTCTASGLTGVLITNYSVSLPVGEKASFTATLQHSGSTTRAVS
jgi:hypothetical protein